MLFSSDDDWWEFGRFRNGSCGSHFSRFASGLCWRWETLRWWWRRWRGRPLLLFPAERRIFEKLPKVRREVARKGILREEAVARCTVFWREIQVFGRRHFLLGNARDIVLVIIFIAPVFNFIFRWPFGCRAECSTWLRSDINFTISVVQIAVVNNSDLPSQEPVDVRL